MFRQTLWSARATAMHRYREMNRNERRLATLGVRLVRIIGYVERRLGMLSYW